MPAPAVLTMPAVLLAQGGGHHHVVTVGFSIGPLVLRMALLAAIPVVAGFAVLHGFLGEPSRRLLVTVLVVAGGAAVLELLLSGGLSVPEQVVPLLLALLAVPLYLVLSRDPRFAPAITRTRRLAPWVFWPVAVVAAGQFWAAWLAGVGAARTATVPLHTGVVLALVALAWFAIVRTERAAGTVGVRVGAVVLAMALMGGAAQATVLRSADPADPAGPIGAGVETGPR